MATLAAVLPDAPGHSGRGVLMPSFTFPATAQAALWAGLDPMLLDIDLHHWHLDPACLERALRPSSGQNAIVLAVSTFGTPPPPEIHQRWETDCRSAGIPLIIDSAAAFGAIAADGTPVGAHGDAEIVSFHATKPFAIGEGGAVFMRSRAIRDRVELAVNFGLGQERSLKMAKGLNAKMSELHAATALAVLDEFDSVLVARRRAAENIRRQADDYVIWQEGSHRSTWQFVPVAFADAALRNRAIESHKDQVEVRTYYEPLHDLPPFRHLPVTNGGLSKTVDLHERILCLPMANDLTALELDAIGQVLHGDQCGHGPPTGASPTSEL